MAEEPKGPVPIDVSLQRKAGLLDVTFTDGARFSLPSEYLRVYSPAAGDRAETGKEGVNIDRIEPQGAAGIRIAFDDGHDTGLYAWETLYDLGRHRERYWQAYLDRLAAKGYQRVGSRPDDAPGAGRVIRLLYFNYLANRMGRESEDVSPPETVATVEQLLAWLRRVKGTRGYLFADDTVRVTVNNRFTEPFTRLDPGDEVAIVPDAPNPPPPPGTREDQADDW